MEIRNGMCVRERGRGREGDAEGGVYVAPKRKGLTTYASLTYPDKRHGDDGGDARWDPRRRRRRRPPCVVPRRLPVRWFTLGGQREAKKSKGADPRRLVQLEDDRMDVGGEDALGLDEDGEGAVRDAAEDGEEKREAVHA